jgi:hypothetical protein
MAIPYPITPAVLKRGTEHVCYEYANLISAAHHDIHGQAPWRTHCDDAFLLGYRKMRDFLLRDKRPERKRVELPDILACDYLPAGFKRAWDLPTWEAEWQLEMDKQLDHITFEREKEWDHRKWGPKLEREMRAAWAEFLKAVVDPHKPEFAAQIAHCQAKPSFAALTL